MATDRADVLVLFYRVTCTEETDDWAPDAFPCMLVLPDEPDPRSELPLRRWSEIRTEPGRWYRFRSLKRHQWVPLTAEQAEWFRGTGWLVEAPRLPKSTAEWEAANHRRTRIAERAEAPRRREAALEVCRQSLRAAAEEAVENLWLPRLLPEDFPSVVSRLVVAGSRQIPSSVVRDNRNLEAPAGEEEGGRRRGGGSA